MPYKDKNKRNENTRKYKLENREELLKRRRELYALKTKDNKKEKIILTEEHKKNLKSIHDKRYREKHLDKIKQQKKEYYNKNKTEINKKYLIKLKENPQKKIAHTIRCRLNQALKGKNKIGSSVKSLGCSIVEFIIYIENKFVDDMSWENHGTYWHLDHIKPLCLFDLENVIDFDSACHYTNYQPLKVIDNLTKNKFYYV